MKVLNSWVPCFLMLGACVTDNSAADLPKPVPKVGPGELGRFVSPFIGTGGIPYLCGNNFPGATVPFGMVRVSPDTISKFGRRASNSSGYFYPDPQIIGFSQTRLVGTGATDGGNFLVIPTFGNLAAKHRKGLLENYSHEKENAFPGYYAVAFPGLGITVELTATCRVACHRYTFEGNRPPHVLIDVTSVLGKGKSSNGQVRILPEKNEVEGSVETFGTFAKRYGGLKTYFVARFDSPVKQVGTWNGSTFSNDPIAVGNDIGVDLGFARVSQSQSIQLKLALSYVSIENARSNLNAEVGTKTFDQILADAVQTWEQKLSIVRVEGATDKDRIIFYSALFRSLQMPTTFNDVNGDYTGFDKKVHRTDGFTYYTDMSLWDTFRTTHPLFTVIQPRQQRDMVVSLIQMAKQGGYLPRWPSGTGYTNSMFGTPADIVVAETYLKGIRDFDVEAAYSSMKKTALAPVPPNSRFSGRDGIEHYLKHEYCPADKMKKSVAATIEYCCSDHAIARLAAALGHTADAAEFNRHAGYYRNLWNPETQFFQPRDSNGKFVAEFRPDLLTYLDMSGKFTHAYVEGSAWQWRWGVASDADALVGLFKSREYFVRELETFFAKSPVTLGQNPNGYYWHGNQPDIYAAYLFNHAGRPDLTQKWVRWILQHKYGTGDNGLDGNDDGGTFSAWYVFSSLGLYPTAGTDHYEIGSPLWSRAEIQLQGKPFVIVAENNGADRPYVQKIWLNEKPLDRYWLHHHEIAAGGSLRFEMGSKPK